MKKIELLKPYAELEIGGEIFRANLTTGAYYSLANYEAQLKNANKIEDILEIYELFIDELFGGGTFYKLNRICDDNVYVMINLMFKIKDSIDETIKSK